jgi:hypothetical protein
MNANSTVRKTRGSPHLQLELDRAKSLLKVSEQRNVMLAQLRCVGIGGLERRSGRPGSDGVLFG